MANRKLPPNLYERKYTTRGGYKRSLFYPRFKSWDGKRRTFPGIEDFKDACRELARLKDLDRQHHDFDKRETAEPTALTLFGWLDRVLALKAHKPVGERHRYSAAHLKGFFADEPPEQITNLKMLEYRGHRTREGASVATVNRELELMKLTLNIIKADGKLQAAPDVPMEKEHNERLRIATDIEYRRILAKLNPDNRDFCIIIREMGFRFKDIFRITPADLDFENRGIHMERIRSKHGRKRSLPASPNVWGILSRRAEGKQSNQRLFQFTRGQATKAFERACAQLKIHGLWLYDLKATFISEKLREGWSHKTIQEFTGHRSLAAFGRYDRPSDDDLRKFIGADGASKTNLRQRHGNKNAFQVYN